LLSGVALERGEPELVTTLVVDDEVHGTVAEVACAVEEDDALAHAWKRSAIGLPWSGGVAVVLFTEDHHDVARRHRRDDVVEVPRTIGFDDRVEDLVRHAGEVVRVARQRVADD